MTQLLLPIIYLAFISLGLPDSLLGSAWPTMYPLLGVPFSYAGILSMIISLGTIASSLNSDRLTRALGTGKVTALSVGMTAAALFGFSGLRPVLDALPVGCALRPGRGQRRCRPEQLRRPALPAPPHELAALYVGRGYHHRPRGDGRGAFRRTGLEQRLPVHCPVPDRTDCCAFLQPAPVAQTPRCRPGRHRAQGADPAAGVRAAGREGSDALLLLLLRAGDHCRALGKQLPDPCAAGARPDGCQLCQPVLYRHYK